jgi:hypothetical protein
LDFISIDTADSFRDEEFGFDCVMSHLVVAATLFCSLFGSSICDCCELVWLTRESVTWRNAKSVPQRIGGKGFTRECQCGLPGIRTWTRMRRWGRRHIKGFSVVLCVTPHMSHISSGPVESTNPQNSEGPFFTFDQPVLFAQTTAT